MSKEDLELTIEGKAKLEAELDELINVRRPENVEALKNYAVHPEHVHVADTYVRPFTATRSCLDFEI